MCRVAVVERFTSVKCFTSANFSTGYVRLNSRYKHERLLGDKSGTLLQKLRRESIEIWFRN
jgi:hypothetical protein